MIIQTIVLFRKHISAPFTILLGTDQLFFDKEMFINMIHKLNFQTGDLQIHSETNTSAHIQSSYIKFMYHQQ